MSTYEIKRQFIPYGLHIPYDRGYDARSRRKLRRAEDLGASGYFRSSVLSSEGTDIALWLTDVQADFSVSGQTGQSRMLREFFPRSFNDVTLTLTGNVANTQEFNRLATFVRLSHWKALQAINNGLKADPTITFGLYDNTPKAFQNPKRSTKGAHRAWQVQGYVKEMKAGAIAHEVAPEFTISFIVAYSTYNANTGLWSDVAAQPSVLKNILQLVNGQMVSKGADGYVSNPTHAPPLPSKGLTPPPPLANGWSISGAANHPAIHFNGLQGGIV